jgi:hypothetical protein
MASCDFGNEEMLAAQNEKSHCDEGSGFFHILLLCFQKLSYYASLLQRHCLSVVLVDGIYHKFRKGILKCALGIVTKASLNYILFRFCSQ